MLPSSTSAGATAWDCSPVRTCRFVVCTFVGCEVAQDRLGMELPESKHLQGLAQCLVTPGCQAWWIGPDNQGASICLGPNSLWYVSRCCALGDPTPCAAQLLVRRTSARRLLGVVSVRELGPQTGVHACFVWPPGCGIVSWCGVCRIAQGGGAVALVLHSAVLAACFAAKQAKPEFMGRHQSEYVELSSCSVQR